MSFKSLEEMSASERVAYQMGRMSVSESGVHPHEPEIPPAWDIDGRCLVCALASEMEELRGALARYQALELAAREVVVLEHDPDRSQEANEAIAYRAERFTDALANLPRAS